VSGKPEIDETREGDNNMREAVDRLSGLVFSPPIYP
jgi:hypothetical protein